MSSSVAGAESKQRALCGFDFFGFDGRVFGQLDRVLPILPSAGVVIEF